MPTWLFSSISFLVAFGLYMLFAGEFSGTEIAAGLPVACLIAAFAGLQHRGQRRVIRLRAPWFRLVFSSFNSLLCDVVRVGACLLRVVFVPGSHVRGTVNQQPFHPGGTTPADAGRRALVTLASSLAPNGIVLEIAPSMLPGNEQTVLMHRLAPSAAQLDAEWLL